MRYCVTLTMSSTVMSASFSMAVMRPGDFRLTGDIGRQFPRRIQTRRARGKQPACPGGRFDRIAVGADLTRNSDVVGLVGHGRLRMVVAKWRPPAAFGPASQLDLPA